MKFLRWIAAVVTTAALALGSLAARQGPAGPSSDGWAQATPDRSVRLPDDHRSHPEFRLEWWYYTGQLWARQRRFGYQVTFFRLGVNPEPPTPSRWAIRDVFMTHVALTDLAEQRHVAFERLNRAAVGWAGASETTYEVWNENWRGWLDDRRHRLVASTQAFSLDLTLEEGKPPVLHGVGGYSQKGSSAGNASYYYSLTRMPTRGTLTLDGERFAVEGVSWMDHEFGTTFLEPDQEGWDWFSLQLDDGTDLMMFRLRGRDGSIDPRSSGTVVDPGGRSRALETASFALDPGRIWSSPATGGRYPVEWRVRVPAELLDLAVRASVDSQELSGLASGVAYWEGVVDVDGTRGGRRVTGRGYLEMTGYAGKPMGEVMGSGNVEK